MLVCDSMKCPIGSRKCSVKKSTTDDLNWIIRTKICFNLNGRYIFKP